MECVCFPFHPASKLRLFPHRCSQNVRASDERAGGRGFRDPFSAKDISATTCLYTKNVVNHHSKAKSDSRLYKKENYVFYRNICPVRYTKHVVFEEMRNDPCRESEEYSTV